MRLIGLVIAMGLFALTGDALGQTVVASMQIQGASAATWTDGDTHVIQITGPVTIELERTKLTADRAVVWLRPVGGTVVDQQLAEIALLGDATVKQIDASRSAAKLFVTATIKGSIRITATERTVDNLSASPVYQDALAVRQVNQRTPAAADAAASPALPPRYRPALPITPAPPAPPVSPPSPIEVRFQADEAPITRAADGTYVITLRGNLLLLVDRADDDHLEMRADSMVLFTKFKTIEEARKAGANLRDKIDAVYLEGDVRISHVGGANNPGPEQRMTAERAYYELSTDRAILTDAVFQTLEPKTQMPVVMRAETLRKLAGNEFAGEKIQLTTSTFANPSFAVAADRAYIRRDPTGDERLGDRFIFSARHITPRFFGVPVFWLPVAGGSVTENAWPLRNIQVGSSSKFGFNVQTEWGLLESLGYPTTRDLDLSYRLDYYADRGPAGGIDAKYRGGFVTENTRQAWNFAGDFKSYFVQDDGVDDLGGGRPDVDPNEHLRGRVLWHHQHFLPDNWQVQLRAGYVSDATFLEQWFPREWEDGQPNDLSAYFKRQRDSEALTLYMNYQPSKIVTDAEFVQEQFEVAHLPEIGYRRIGDSFADDSLTFFSDNTVSALRFQETDRTLLDQGFFTGNATVPDVLPGLPATGQTGVSGSTTYRGDFRQEIDYPINAGKFKFVPYVMGRLTSYSDSPDDGDEHRLYAGTGLRVGTSFWRTDDTAESSLFDIHRLRHVIEPTLNLYTAVQTTERDSVFIYDDEVDEIHDISAVNVGVSQRWQTKRGGPGRWRSVDFFTLNTQVTYFANEPADDENPPTAFRGLFFPSLPETSVPRDSFNADAAWRISDDTVLLGDAQYNLEEVRLATAAIGLAVRRDERLSWYVGTSYIEELDSNITSVGLNYQISKKYTFGYTQAFDFGRNEGVNYLITLNRKFDTFFLLFRATYDEVEDESSIGVNLLPMGARSAFGTDTATVFAPNRP